MAKLSSSDRQHLPKSDYARNALARSSGKPEAAAVRRKVHEKYPGIGIAKAPGE